MLTPMQLWVHAQACTHVHKYLEARKWHACEHFPDPSMQTHNCCVHTHAHTPHTHTHAWGLHPVFLNDQVKRNTIGKGLRMHFLLLLCVFFPCYEMENQLEWNKGSSQKIRCRLLGNQGSGIHLPAKIKRKRRFGSAGSQVSAPEIHETLTRGSLPGYSSPSFKVILTTALCLWLLLTLWGGKRFHISVLFLFLGFSKRWERQMSWHHVRVNNRQDPDSDLTYSHGAWLCAKCFCYLNSWNPKGPVYYYCHFAVE